MAKEDKKETMKKKTRDRHLDIPAEANRDKHINFVALEQNEDDPATIPAGRYGEEKANDRKGESKKGIIKSGKKNKNSCHGWQEDNSI